VSATNKSARFLANYTFLNIGWTVGPPIGTLLVMYSINLPFWLPPVLRCRWCLSISWAKAFGRIPQRSKCRWQVPVGTAERPRAVLVYALSLLASYVGGSFAILYFAIRSGGADGDFAEKWSPWSCPSTPPWW
jgi:hypothetical protein